jgi:hypothetical protein
MCCVVLCCAVLCCDLPQGRVGTIIAAARSERAEREARSQALRDADINNKGHTMLQTLVRVVAEGVCGRSLGQSRQGLGREGACCLNTSFSVVEQQGSHGGHM